jgi:hypothetical protein
MMDTAANETPAVQVLQCDDGLILAAPGDFSLRRPGVTATRAGPRIRAHFIAADSMSS